MVKADGTFAGSVPIPPGIRSGTRTLQANGFSPTASVRSLSTGVVVQQSGPLFL
jgi:hypothetical protein